MRQHSLYNDGTAKPKRRSASGMRCAMGLPYRPSWGARAAQAGCAFVSLAIGAALLVMIYNAGLALFTLVIS